MVKFDSLAGLARQEKRFSSLQMDYAPGEMSPFLTTGKKALSSKALSTLRVMAFLDPNRINSTLFEPLAKSFAPKNAELKFDYPTSGVAHREACAELVKALLIHRSIKDKTYTMSSETQTSVLADTQTVGLLSPLFNMVVKVLNVLWPQMICVPDRTVDQDEFRVATAPGTTYEAYLKKRYSDNQLPPFQEYIQYSKHNVWGRRDELVHHASRLEHIFYHADDEMVEVCATIPFAMLLTEASWFALSRDSWRLRNLLNFSRYSLERSRYYDANVKIQSALGVYELGNATSSLHYASIYRVHAAVALECGKSDEAAQYVKLQMEQLTVQETPQGDAFGLFDRAPDAVSLSSWDLDVYQLNPAVFVVLPFRSIRRFGWKLYLSAQDEKDPKHAQVLRQAELCFSAALQDCKNARMETPRMNSQSVRPHLTSSLRLMQLTVTSIAELFYALGNVAHKSASFLGRAHLDESLEYYEKALLHFQRAVTNSNGSTAGIAKTHYKLALLSVWIHDYKRAMYSFNLNRLRITLTHHLVTMLIKRSISTPATRLTNPISLDCFSKKPEYRI